MDTETQTDTQMTMKEWCKYFEDKEHDRLLNVISLEFSHTRLENYVESPTFVSYICNLPSLVNATKISAVLSLLSCIAGTSG